MSTAMPIVYDPDEDLSWMRVSMEELSLNQIPLHARDGCAHLLIELKRCQRRGYYLPWKCETEKHNYEACMVHDIIRRKKILLREQHEQNEQNEQRDLREQREVSLPGAAGSTYTSASTSASTATTTATATSASPAQGSS